MKGFLQIGYQTPNLIFGENVVEAWLGISQGLHRMRKKVGAKDDKPHKW
jgi:hypothetical protein